MTKNERNKIKETIKVCTNYNRWDSRSIEWTLHQVKSRLERLINSEW